GHRDDWHAPWHVRAEALPHATGVLRGDGGDDHRRRVEAVGVVGGEPHLLRYLHARQQAVLRAVMAQTLDRRLERAPHRDAVAARGEQEGADGRHRAVAEDRDVLRHAGGYHRPPTGRVQCAGVSDAPPADPLRLTESPGCGYSLEGLA